MRPTGSWKRNSARRRIIVYAILATAGAGLFAPRATVDAAAPRSEGCVVLASRVATEVHFRLVASTGEVEQGVLTPGAVRSFRLSNPTEIFFTPSKVSRGLKLQADQAYVFVPGRTRDAFELQQLDFDEGRFDVEPAPDRLRPLEERLAAGVLPVRVLLDGREPETLAVAERRLRRRMEDASSILEPATGMRLEVVSVGTWDPSPAADSWAAAVCDFETRAPLETARLVVGFTRQYGVSPDELAKSTGVGEPLGTHLLVPEATIGTSPEKCLEMLLHELGHFFGAVHVPEPSSPMRLTLHEPTRPWPLAYDPASALAMRMVAEEVRTRGIQSLEELSAGRRRHLEAIRARIASAHAPDALALPAPAPAAARRFTLRVAEARVPDISGGYAIWTGVSRDRAGQFWFAVSSEGVARPSAHLFQWDARREARDCGDVVTALRALGRYRDGEFAGLVCSPIVEAEDGNLYFASIGEDRPRPDGHRAPPWGSHLWRVRRPTNTWELLRSVPEGLVAVACHGDFVYALGYPGHRLYQFHVPTGRLRDERVGSAGGHACRTIVIDARGHVFIPRIAAPREPDQPPHVELVELNEELKVVHRTPLEHYEGRDLREGPGIVAAFKDDAAVSFVTSTGAVYRLEAPVHRHAPAAVEFWGTLCELEASRVMSVALDDAGEELIAVAQSGGSKDAGANRIAVLSAELMTLQPALQPFGMADKLPGLEFTGPAASDEGGQFWFAGTYARGPLRLTPTILETLERRGFSEARRAQLQENARRSSQPLLYSLQIER